MLFNSLGFAVFLSLVFPLALLLSRFPTSRKVLLCFASYFFYMAWNPPFVLLLIASTCVDYYAARRIYQLDRVGARRAWMLVSCLVNLGVLGFFKYGNFFATTAWAILPIETEVPAFFESIILPLGISFYTFQTLSYTIDVYRGDQKPSDSLLDFAVYVSFFPQLVAGPIVRSKDFLPQLRANKRATSADYVAGIDLFFRGLVKKVFIADNLGIYVDAIHAAPDEFGAINHLISAYAYAFQIYCDFSGYSDMAIGLGRIFGFRIPINFNLPYISKNPAELWTRWHISLSSWLRDYLYVPLGGNRGSTFRTYSNLFITMLLGGLWHGAAWSYVIWGMFHGCWLMLHRAMLELRGPLRIPGWLAMVCTFHLWSLGLVIFRSQSLADLGTILGAFLDFETPFYSVPIATIPLILLCVVSHRFGNSEALQKTWRACNPIIPGLYYAAIVLVLMFKQSTPERFIYFQF